MKYNQTTNIGFTGLLTLLFVGLKLTNYIDWSWIWVLSPIWISVCLGLLLFIIIFIIYIIESLIN